MTHWKLREYEYGNMYVLSQSISQIHAMPNPMPPLPFDTTQPHM